MRLEAGASSPAELARSQIAADIVRADRERARTALAIARLELATLMGDAAGKFSSVTGDLERVGSPPAFQSVRRALDSNPQIIRYSALRAQRDAELLIERLKPIPDVRAGVAWRHYRATNDNALQIGLSVALPLWDQNRGNVSAALESRAKIDAEQAAARASLLLTLGRAHGSLSGATREIEILRKSALPGVRAAVEAMERGYGEGRYSLLELLDINTTATQTALRELETLLNYHTALATIEGLVGMPLLVKVEKLQ